VSYLETIILSIVQGIAEWLPVSSEGLSVLIMLNLFGKDISSALSYAIFLHLGTALAVLIRFRDEFLRMLHGSDMLKIVIVSTISTAVVAIPLLSFIEFQSGKVVNVFIGVLLILTGIILRLPKSGYRRIEQINLSDMIMLGLAQGFAILPGISRSGTTISFLLLRKIDEEDALKISFIISVPAVIGAIFFRGVPSELDFNAGAIIVVITCLFGYLTMEALLRFARDVDFSKFCITFGIIAIVLTVFTL
jgi:undecaprenyl-diphosphatase